MKFRVFGGWEKWEYLVVVEKWESVKREEWDGDGGLGVVLELLAWISITWMFLFKIVSITWNS